MGLPPRQALAVAAVICPFLLAAFILNVVATFPRSDDPDYMAVFQVLTWLDGQRSCNDPVSELPPNVAMCKPVPGGRGGYFVSVRNGSVLKNSTAPAISELNIACLDGRKVIVGSKTGHVFEVEDGVITDFFRLPNDEMGRIENAIEEWESGHCCSDELPCPTQTPNPG